MGDCAEQDYNLCWSNKLKAIPEYSNIKLPYNEVEPQKRYILAMAIYGTHQVGSKLVHPDYVCIQAIKAGQMGVYYEYLPLTSLYGRYAIFRYSCKYGRWDVAFQLINRMPEQLVYLFDRPVENPKDFLATVLNFTDIIKGYKLEQLIAINEQIVSNITKFGNSLVTPELYEFISSTKFTAILRNKRYITEEAVNNYYYQTDQSSKINLDLPINYEYVTLSTFNYIINELLTEQVLDFKVVAGIFSWNRWELWHAFMDQIAGRLNKSVKVESLQAYEEYGLHHLSTLSMSVLYKIYPKAFSQGPWVGQGYVPYLDFCNRHNIVPVVEYIVDDLISLNTVLKNPTLIKLIPKIRLVKSVGELTVLGAAKALATLQSNNTLSIDENYYVSSNSIGMFRQNYAKLLGVMDQYYNSSIFKSPGEKPTTTMEYYWRRINGIGSSLENLYQDYKVSKNDVAIVSALQNVSFIKKANPELLQQVILELKLKDSIITDESATATDLLNKNVIQFINNTNPYNLWILYNKTTTSKDTKNTAAYIKDTFGIDIVQFDPIQYKLPHLQYLIFSQDYRESKKLLTQDPGNHVLYYLAQADINTEDFYALLDKLSDQTFARLIPIVLGLNLGRRVTSLRSWFNYCFETDAINSQGQIQKAKLVRQDLNIESEYYAKFYTAFCLVGMDFISKIYPVKTFKLLVSKILTDDSVPEDTKIFLSSF